MTLDEITKLAREAGLLRAGNGWTEPARWGITELERFAALIAAAEREECAKVCDDIDTEYEGEDVLATWCAAAIREKGMK